jgi:hypothetical protein
VAKNVVSYKPRNLTTGCFGHCPCRAGLKCQSLGIIGSVGFSCSHFWAPKKFPKISMTYKGIIFQNHFWSINRDLDWTPATGPGTRGRVETGDKMPAIEGWSTSMGFDPKPDINVDLYSPTKHDIFSPGHQKGLQENTIPVPPNSEVGASQVAGSWRQITSMIYPLKQLKVTRPSLSFPQILPRIRQFFSVLQLGLSHRSWDSASW